MQPGETIHPGHTDHDPQTTRTPAPATVPAPDDQMVEVGENSLYKPSPENDASAAARGDEQSISWDGSEYIDHQKPAGWYALLVAAAVVLVVLSYVITHGDYMATVTVGIAAVLFGVMAARKPQTLHYVIDHRGVTVGEKLYSFAEFKVFSVIADTAIHSVQLLPMKRFLPPLSLHYPPDQEEKIVATLGSYLPYQEGKNDMVERLMSRIRF